MKRFYIFALVAILFAACENVTTDEGYNSSFISMDASDTLYAEFAEENTRTYVEEGNKLRWTKGDEISYFPAITYNMQYRFKGETGDNSGAFAKVTTDLVTGNKLDNCYAVYPYIESTTMTDDGAISFELPATQHYAENSFGLGANVMVAITESEDDNVLRFKNVGGYLKLQLYGKDVVVKSIELKGNGAEKLAGAATITATYGAEPTIAMAEDATTTLTLDCGEGVELSNDAETATAFWFVLPATTFENGITVTVTDTEGKIFEKSTSNSLTIERNHIQPMAAFEIQEEVPSLPIPANNEIWYAANEKVTPYEDDVFGANIISNEWDSTTDVGVITFDGKVASIGEQAFSSCSSLTNIAIPDSVTEIGQSAFGGCTSLTSVTIGNGVTSIGEWAFSGCRKLQSISLPNTLRSIGKCAFQNCSVLSDIVLPNMLNAISDSMFANCNTLTNITLPKNITSIGDYAFYYCNLTNITIPDKVSSIGNYAFYHCELIGLTIPASVTSIGHNAFEGSSGELVINCNIPGGQSNNTRPFNNTAFTKITISDNVTSIGRLAFYDCDTLRELTIGKNVTSIGERAFSSCSSLTSVTIPDSVTSIGTRSFSGCSSLLSATIGNNVTSIAEGAFTYCSSLTSVTIPDSVTSIGDAAFSGCGNLTSVIIGNGVTTIGTYAFSECSSLKEVYCKPTTPPSGGRWMFRSNASGRMIYVPRASVDAYKAAEYWSAYADDIEPYDFE